MAKRSFQASTSGIFRVKQAIARKHLTQQTLAEQVGLKTRQPIGRLLAGKPIDRGIFMELCFQLDLDWRDIVLEPINNVPEPGEIIQNLGVDIDTLVQEVRSRYQDKVQARCSTLQMWAVSQLIGLKDIYIDVNILKTLPNQQWLEKVDLVKGFDPSGDHIDYWSLNRVPQERLLGIETAAKYSKLMVLGKPGTGKTTFLKFLALECIQGRFQSHRLPVFFYLKYLVDELKDEQLPSLISLKDHICQEFTSCGFDAAVAETLLARGRLLILLDGLDEVPESSQEKLFQKINQLCQTYYQNQFVISSRIAAWSYRFPGFIDVEIADFTSQQIQAFATKYFVATAKKNREEGLIKASLFIEQLEQKENQGIRELVTTPLLLNLACVGFQATGKFPNKRSKLYEEGLNILLVKWDRSKGIKRDEVYWSLSLAEKIKLLKRLGFITFEQGDYFFEQGIIEQHIADFLRLLPEGETDPVVLQLDSRTVLKSIESQHGLLVERSHGIYSFSHVTFQEYLAARYITMTNNSVGKNRDKHLQTLVRHVSHRRWREVFLLATELLPKADDLLRLMKQQIDQLIVSDAKLQQFLSWVNEKSKSASIECKPAARRAVYFSLALALNHYFACALGFFPGSSCVLSLTYFPLSLFLSLASALDYNSWRYRDFNLKLNFQKSKSSIFQGVQRVYVLERIVQFALEYDLALAGDRVLELQQQLQTLKDQLPSQQEASEEFEAWGQENYQAWTEQLKAILIEHQNAGHHWHFSKEQTQVLFDYYNANKLLVDCLKSDCVISAAVQQEIEETLLLLNLRGESFPPA